MKGFAVDIQRRSQARIGRVGRYPNKDGMIGRSIASGGAAVKLRASKYPWALGAEYGEAEAHVPQYHKNTGRKPSIPYPQRKFKARTMGVFKPPTSPDMFKNHGGYMIQPTLRARLPFIEKELNKDFTRLFDVTLRKAGVPG
jgi:hypothetical protein